VEEVFLPAFSNAMLGELNDSSLCDVGGSTQIAMTTDSYVVHPLFFPGGDIGRLAVCGTVNDLSMSGAIPKYLTCGMIIEAGFPVTDLKRICASMAEAAREAGVSIVTGDTKVVEKGNCDGIYINTAGVGIFPDGRKPLPQKIEKGDAILVSGTIADHGITLLAEREKLAFQTPLGSDANPLNGLTAALMHACSHVHALRDATRGGVASVLNEWADKAKMDILLQQENIPVKPVINAACELLGLDPLFIANEGKFMAAVPMEEAEAALLAMRAHPLGKDAALIGRVEEGRGLVTLEMPYGGSRVVDVPDGDQLPRIC